MHCYKQLSGYIIHGSYRSEMRDVLCARKFLATFSMPEEPWREGRRRSTKSCHLINYLGVLHMEVLMTCGDCWCHVTSICSNPEIQEQGHLLITSWHNVLTSASTVRPSFSLLNCTSGGPLDHVMSFNPSLKSCHCMVGFID